MATVVAPDNYLVTSMELEDPYHIHSIQKRELAHRVALKVLKHSYHMDLYADQPVLKQAYFEKNKVILKFDYGEGLYCNRSLASVKMYVADERRVFKKAKIQIQNDMLILTSDEVEYPTIARYAFENCYLGTHIYNKAGLPIAPFRTDREITV